MPEFSRRKLFGQNFLRDRKVIDGVIARTLELVKECGTDRVLEIGPGDGALTTPLLAHQKDGTIRLTLAERDPKIIELWRDGGAELLEGDFLKLDPALWLEHAPLGVVSNLPYSSGTAIFNRLAEHPSKIRYMILMFQAEVAERIRAEPGSRAFGSLSLWSQNLWEITKLMSVPKEAFSPPPKVRSELIVCLPRATPKIAQTADKTCLDLWQELILEAFKQRRKMLRAVLGKHPNAKWRNALDASGVDGTKRAEALSWGEWESLLKAVPTSAR